MAFFSMKPSWARMFAGSCLRITRNIRRTAAPQFATSPIKPWGAFFLALFAVVARLAGAGAVPGAALQRVLLHTLTLLRAARTERPPGTGEVAEAAVEPGVTQAGSVQSVAVALVGTVAWFVAVLPKETFWATVLAELSQHTGGTVALPRAGVTGASVLALADTSTSPAKRPRGTGLIADGPSPAGRADAAAALAVAAAPVQTILTPQAAVLAKRVTQAHNPVHQGELSSGVSILSQGSQCVVEQLGGPSELQPWGPSQPCCLLCIHLLHT